MGRTRSDLELLGRGSRLEDILGDRGLVLLDVLEHVVEGPASVVGLDLALRVHEEEGGVAPDIKAVVRERSVCVEGCEREIVYDEEEDRRALDATNSIAAEK